MTVKIFVGDCRAVLRSMPEESVHCGISSPPYYGLRDYGIEPTIWGGDPICAHDFEDEKVESALRLGIGLRELSVKYRGGGGKAGRVEPISTVRGTCRHCGAWRGNFGLEPSPELYIEHAVEVMREVRRVLRSDGTFWLNLGDSYANDGKWGGETGGKQHYLGEDNRKRVGREKRRTGLKPKDLVGIPWRVALALQADGWWLRQDIIWHKPNPMPESVTDRCTKSHEYLFLLTKSERYFYDAAAIAEETEYPPGGSHDERGKGEFGGKRSEPGDWQQVGQQNFRAIRETRNKRSVWTIATRPYVDAHFATFPPDLVEPCIKAGTSEHGCCGRCGAQFEGQAPTCKCGAAQVPCIVLDPFGGAGTTALVANRLQRSACIIELSPKYAEMARRRIADEGGLFAAVSIETPKAEAAE